MNGWAGVILRVDLSSGAIEKQPLQEYLRLNYVGGRGINSRILFEETGPETDPLSPENRLIFASGLLSGTSAPCAARFTVTAKSPLTGILGDGNGGGYFGPALKRAGIDHIVFYGKAAEPVYLWIDNGKAEIRSARHLWGKNTRETEIAIKEELKDKRVRIASIGQAGENLVRIAGIIQQERSASRTGIGAVMGSKNLKAVAVRGSKNVKLFDTKGFNSLAKELQKKISASPAYGNFRKYSGIAGVAPTNKAGFLSVKNFNSAGEFEGIGNFDAQKVADLYYEGDMPCFGCPIRCGKKFKVKEGPYAGEWGKKTEEGAFTPLGPVCGNDNIASIFKMNNMANQFGIDLVELGQGMAVVMEWYEKGIVTEKDLDGLSLHWGNHEAMMKLIEMTAFRQGFGDILSDGIVIASKKFGKDAEACVSHSKGMVMAGIDVRMLKGTALGFATSTRGADHLRGLVPVEFPWFSKMTPEEAQEKYGTAEVLDPVSYNKASAVIQFQHQFVLPDLFEVCRFSVRAGSKDFSFGELFKLYSLATGIETDEKEMMKTAERVYNLERAYICREGIRRKDDHLIGKWADEPIPNGPYKGEKIDPEKWELMLDDYYRMRGWNQDGVPEIKKLKELGLDDVASNLEKAGAYL
jgi:aldehyde:ferredoxin oxidoreductase